MKKWVFLCIDIQNTQGKIFLLNRTQCKWEQTLALRTVSHLHSHHQVTPCIETIIKKKMKEKKERRRGNIKSVTSMSCNFGSPLLWAIITQEVRVSQCYMVSQKTNILFLAKMKYSTRCQGYVHSDDLGSFLQ